MLQLWRLRVARHREHPLPATRARRGLTLQHLPDKAKCTAGSRSSNFIARTWWTPRRPSSSSSEAAPRPPAVTQAPALWMLAVDFVDSRKGQAGPRKKKKHIIYMTSDNPVHEKWQSFGNTSVHLFKSETMLENATDNPVCRRPCALTKRLHETQAAYPTASLHDFSTGVLGYVLKLRLVSKEPRSSR